MSYVHELFKHLNTSNIINLLYQIRFVAYNITDSGPDAGPDSGPDAGHSNNNPFIRFLFEQSDIEEGYITFPAITGPINDLQQQCVNIFPEFKEVQYSGHIIYNKVVYAFINIQDNQTSMQFQKYSKRIFCLLDEILNYQCVLGCFKIQPECVDFLFSNSGFYLLKATNKTYEIPYVAYIGTDNVHQSMIDNYFGPTKTDYKHYILETYEQAASKKGGIIRYAVFKTTPITEGGQTLLLVETLNNIVSLSWSSVDIETQFIS